jgi:hypothetical protein
MTSASFWQVTGAPDSVKQAAGRASCSVPVVVVLSVNVPSELAVQVPVTWRDPVT